MAAARRRAPTNGRPSPEPPCRGSKEGGFVSCLDCWCLLSRSPSVWERGARERIAPASRTACPCRCRARRERTRPAEGRREIRARGEKNAPKRGRSSGCGSQARGRGGGTVARAAPSRDAYRGVRLGAAVAGIRGLRRAARGTICAGRVNFCGCSRVHTSSAPEYALDRTYAIYMAPLQPKIRLRVPGEKACATNAPSRLPAYHRHPPRQPAQQSRHPSERSRRNPAGAESHCVVDHSAGRSAHAAGSREDPGSSYDQ